MHCGFAEQLFNKKIILLLFLSSTDIYSKFLIVCIGILVISELISDSVRIVGACNKYAAKVDNTKKNIDSVKLQR